MSAVVDSQQRHIFETGRPLRCAHSAPTLPADEDVPSLPKRLASYDVRSGAGASKQFFVLRKNSKSHIERLGRERKVDFDVVDFHERHVTQTRETPRTLLLDNGAIQQLISMLQGRSHD